MIRIIAAALAAVLLLSCAVTIAGADDASGENTQSGEVSASVSSNNSVMQSVWIIIMFVAIAVFGVMFLKVVQKDKKNIHK